jgi:hypothetical protein
MADPGATRRRRLHAGRAWDCGGADRTASADGNADAGGHGADE